VFPRFAHIVKSSAASDGKQTYEVYDANRRGDEESGLAEPLLELTRDGMGQWLAREGVPFSEIDEVLQRVDRNGSASVRLKAKVGPRIVRAWFDTVINPLIGSLETEMALAAKENWTWRYAPPRLELIRPAQRYLEPIAAASLEQISDLDPEIRTMIRSHDALVHAALEKAAALHGALITSSTFTALCDSLWNPEALAAAGIQEFEVFGGYAPKERYELIAQYIVNSTGDLPEYYGTSKFWNRYRSSLVRTLDSSEIHPNYEALVQVGANLITAARALLRRLKEVRLALSLEHDVPYVVGSSVEIAS
jgi:hypothetical protein